MPISLVIKAAVVYVISIVIMYHSTLFGMGLSQTASLSRLLDDTLAKKLMYLALALYCLFPLLVSVAAVIVFVHMVNGSPFPEEIKRQCDLLFAAVMALTLVASFVFSRSKLYYKPMEKVGALTRFAWAKINPEGERERQDQVRVSTFFDFRWKMMNYVKYHPSDKIGEPKVVYISVPDSSPTCANLRLPPLEPGWCYHCVPENRSWKIDGTGWIPINLKNRGYEEGGRYIGFSLQPDPVNTADSGHYYSFQRTEDGGWELRGRLTSQRVINDYDYPDRLESGRPNVIKHKDKLFVRMIVPTISGGADNIQ